MIGPGDEAQILEVVRREMRTGNLATLVRQLQGMGLPPGERMVRGVVSSTGAVTAGDGFSVVKNGMGDFTVTYDVPFKSIPAVGGTAPGGTVGTVNLVASTATAARLVVKDGAGAAVDVGVHFQAVG